MKMNKIRSSVLCTAILSFSLIQPISAFTIDTQATYNLIDLGTLGGTRSFASAINNNGVVVGTSYDSSNAINSFRYDGTMQLLSPDAYQALGINDRGQVVGSTRGLNRSFIYDNGAMTYINADNAYDINNNSQVVGYVRSSTNYAALYENNTITNLGMLPGASNSGTTAINDHGVIVGNSGGTAFVYENGLMQSLFPITSNTYPLAGSVSLANDINNKGQIIGFHKNTDGLWDTFLYDNGIVSSFDFNGANTLASAINDIGMVVGRYQTGYSSWDTSAMLMDVDGSFIDLNNLVLQGANFDLLTRANDINNLGQIVGSGMINGQEHAFLLSPISSVPEPETLWLTGIGLLGLFGMSRKKTEQL